MLAKNPATAVFVFLAALFVYQANLRPVASLDSLPAALLPFSILIDHTFHFDRYFPFLQGDKPGMPYYFHEKEGHYYSTYPIVMPILLTPLYIPVFAVVHPARWKIGDQILFARILEKLMAGLLAGASVAFFFVLLDRLTSRRNALLLAAAYAFGTTTWAISSQALWLHTGCGVLFVLALLALQRWADQPDSLRFLALAGLSAGLALMVRPTVGLFACAILLALLIRRAPVRALAAFLVPVIVCGTGAAAYNLWLFQDLRGYCSIPPSRDPLGGLAGILFSPSRGLLIYCPFLLFGVAGLVCWRKRPEGALSLLLSIGAAFCVAHLALISLVDTWWAGHCWGPRYLTEMMPFLTLMIIPALDAVMASSWQRPLFLFLLLYSVALQSVGAFFYPKGLWDDKPVSADDRHERYWDWVDNPINRTVRAGPMLTPHQILLEGALHGKTAAIRKMREAEFKGF